MGSFSGSLTSPKHRRAQIADLPVVCWGRGGWSGRIRNCRCVTRGPGDFRRTPCASGTFPAGAVVGRRCAVRAAFLHAGPMRQGAERRQCSPQHASSQSQRRHVSKTASRRRNSGIASRPSERKSCCSGRSPSRDTPAATRRSRSAARARAGPRRLARADAHPTAPDRARRADHAGQHEILGLPLFRQQPALRSAVPQRLQGRSQGPSQLFRPGLLAGRDLQRQPRAGARARDISTPASPA